MKMPIRKTPVIKIALTHLFSKKRQTIVAMLGVTFGIAIFIFQAGLITGFQSTFIEQTVNTTANIRIYNESNKISPPILSAVDTSSKKWAEKFYWTRYRCGCWRWYTPF